MNLSYGQQELFRRPELRHEPDGAGLEYTQRHARTSRHAHRNSAGGSCQFPEMVEYGIVICLVEIEQHDIRFLGHVVAPRRTQYSQVGFAGDQAGQRIENTALASN